MSNFIFLIFDFFKYINKYIFAFFKYIWHRINKFYEKYIYWYKEVEYAFKIFTPAEKKDYEVRRIRYYWFLFIYKHLRRILGLRYFRRMYAFIVGKCTYFYQYFFISDEFLINKIFFFFKDLNFLHNLFIDFNLNYFRFLLYKMFIIGFTLSLYYYILYNLWRISDIEDDIWTWESFFYWLLFFMTSVSIIGNPHLFVSIFN